MLETRSAVFKMLKNVAHEERQVRKWPPPFSSEITPYYEKDYDAAVKNACISNAPTLGISKVIVIGDVAVGKTSLVNRFCHKLYNNNYKATIGVDFEVERFDILGIPFHLQIWDTAGQERFKCIAASYYRGANVILIVFDLGNLVSLVHCQQWLSEAYRSNNGPCHIFIVGAKRDLLSNQMYEVIKTRIVEVANSLRAEYWAVSARTGDGVSELFTRIAALSFNAMVLRELQHFKMEPINISTELISLKRQSTQPIPKERKMSRCFDCRV